MGKVMFSREKKKCEGKVKNVLFGKREEKVNEEKKKKVRHFFFFNLYNLDKKKKKERENFSNLQLIEK